MAGTTKKRLRRVAQRIERQRRAAVSRSVRPAARRAWYEPPPEEPDGGAGVREPRRPLPSGPSGAMQLTFEPEQQLDLTAR